MATIGDVDVIFTGDASSLIAATQASEAALAELGTTAEATAGEVAASGTAMGASAVDVGAIGAGALGGGLGFPLAAAAIGLAAVNIGKGIVDTQSGLEGLAATGQTFADSMGQSADAAGGSFVNTGNKVATTALEISDAMITYSEKIKKIQDEIATVTSGQDILDQQQTLTDELDSLAEQHAQKVEDLNAQIDQSNQDLADREADRQQSLNDSLSNLQGSHENQIANVREEYGQKIANTNSQVEKDKLTEEMNQRITLLDDEFAREYALKQSEGQRTLDEQNARDQEATTQHIASINNRITQENDAYDRQVQKDQERSDDAIAKLKAADAKKLAEYKQSLDDEARAHELQMLKLQDQAAGAASATQKAIKAMVPGDAFFASQKSLENLAESARAFKALAPIFSLEDIEQADVQIAALGGDTEKLNPIYGNIAAAAHKSMTDTETEFERAASGQAGVLGRIRAEYGITADDWVKAGAQVDLTTGKIIVPSQEKMFEVIQKIEQEKYSDGIARQNDTIGGSLARMGWQWEEFELGMVDEIGLMGKGIRNFSQGVDEFTASFTKDIGDAMSGFGTLVHNIEQGVESILNTLGNLKNKASDALSYLNPFAKHSPSLIDQISAGTDQIKSMYGALDLNVSAPSMSSSQDNSSHVYAPQQNNYFNMSGQMNGENLSEYLAFQLEHQGIV